MKKSLVFSIMPLATDHLKEICQDIKEQYEKGIADFPLFIMSLVPEGNPPVDKAASLSEKYILFRDRLHEMGLKSGILIQSSIGHGYRLPSPSPFPKYVNLNDGKEEEICCPYDEGLGDHFRQMTATLAKAEPDIMMLDDDFRLLFRGGNGCACKRHMARFNELAGTTFTREELFAHLQKENDGEYAHIFIETQKEALMKAARALREGIDSVNPSLLCTFCAAGNNAESAVENSAILAGKGNPIVIRVSNGSYVPAGTRFFTKDFYRAAIQIAALGGKADYILAESDSCPQNRYAMSAQWFHSHYVGTILEGTNGAKHWITRTACHEPESGKAYRKILAKNRGFYEALSELAPTLQYEGCRIPLKAKPVYYFSENGWESNNDHAEGWATHVLEKMGLPLYFSAKPGGATFLSGMVDKKLSHEDLTEIFRRPVIMASDVAQRLFDRGYGDLLGVAVREWTGKCCTTELIPTTGQRGKTQMGIKELAPLHDAVAEKSTNLYTLDQKNFERLFPACTLHRNALGGTSVVFCGTPITEFNYVEAFSFLTYSRKMQLVEILKECGCLPVYYAEDEEVYFKAARTQDGKLFCAIFNLSYDVIDEIALSTEENVTKVEMLGEDGKLRPCSFRKEKDRLTVEQAALPLNPVILFLS